jgi:hypothetical protein
MPGKILQPSELLHHDLKVLYDYRREKKGSTKAPSRGHIANDTDDRYVFMRADRVAAVHPTVRQST